MGISNSQVAHLWAQQRKESAKGSHFYFEGPTIYSYGRHFPIATFIRPDVVLFTTDSYSNSTCKHIGHARHAIPGNMRVFHVPHVLGERHADNVRSYLDRFQTALEKAGRARKGKEYWLSHAQGMQYEARAYCEMFGQPFPVQLAEEISPALIEAARVAAANEKARNRERDLERARIRAEEEKQARDEWRAGLNSRYFSNPIMLRKKGTMVETSAGAFVPVKEARQLWQMVQTCKQEARHLVPLKAYPVGEFTLLEIDANGNATVGCHLLDYAECEMFARAQGWPV